MEYYGNNDYRDYLAHYGRKGMKWHKHLPGVDPDGNNQRLNPRQRLANHYREQSMLRRKLTRLETNRAARAKTPEEWKEHSDSAKNLAIGARNTAHWARQQENAAKRSEERKKNKIPADLEAIEMGRDNKAMEDRKKKAAVRKVRNTGFNKVGLKGDEFDKLYGHKRKSTSRKEREKLEAKATFSDIRDGYKLTKKQRKNKNIKKAQRMIWKRLGYRPRTRYE